MEYHSKAFRIQRRVGMAFAAAFGALIILQTIRIVLLTHFPVYFSAISSSAPPDEYATTLIMYIASYVLLGAVFLVSSLHNRSFWRYFQVAVFLLLGFILLLVSQGGDLTAPMFLVTGIIVAYQYGMMKTRILLKLSLILVIAVACRVGSAFLIERIGLMEVLFTLLAILLFAYVYYALFQEQIEEQQLYVKEMQRQLSESEQYSQLGRNVTDILHNMKNVWFALNQGLELLQGHSDEELSRVNVDRMQLISSLRYATESFSEKIENIVAYTSSFHREDTKRIGLIWNTARLVEIFCIDKSFKEKVEVELNIPGDLQIEISPNKLNQIQENLLMNSWEAIKEHRGTGHIRFSAHSVARFVVLKVEDDGGGIPGFEEAGLNGSSMLGSTFFSIGKTSKPYGSGHGLAYVIDVMRELGGDVIVSSETGVGTTIELRFPKPAADSTVVQDPPIMTKF